MRATQAAVVAGTQRSRAGDPFSARRHGGKCGFVRGIGIPVRMFSAYVFFPQTDEFCCQISTIRNKTASFSAFSHGNKFRPPFRFLQYDGIHARLAVAANAGRREPSAGFQRQGFPMRTGIEHAKTRRSRTPPARGMPCMTEQIRAAVSPPVLRRRRGASGSDGYCRRAGLSLLLTRFPAAAALPLRRGRSPPSRPAIAPLAAARTMRRKVGHCIWLAARQAAA